MGFERIILIDAGPKSAKNEKGKAYIPYETRVIPRLLEVKKERDANADDIRAGQPKLALDLVVCTHIDDDHIAGVERLYGCLSGDTTCAKDGDKVEAKRLWFNSFSALLGDAVDIAAAALGETPEAVAASVGQGENPTTFALSCGAEINKDAPGRLMAVGQQPSGFLPAKVTILNPDKKALEKLRKDWLAAVGRKARRKPARRSPPASTRRRSRPTTRWRICPRSSCWWKGSAVAFCSLAISAAIMCWTG